MITSWDQVDTDKVNNFFEVIKKEQAKGGYTLGETMYAAAVMAAAVLVAVGEAADRNIILISFTELILKTMDEITPAKTEECSQSPPLQ